MKKTKSKTKTKIKKVKVSFSKLPKWKQRVELAKDVIQQLKVQSLIAETGHYLDFTFTNSMQDIPSCDLQANEALKKGLALFMSHVMKTNHLLAEDVNSFAFDDTIKERLSKIFSIAQLDMMEAAFEEGVVCDDSGTLWADKGQLAIKCSHYRKEGETDNNVLIRIMKNIISNKGTFKP